MLVLLLVYLISPMMGPSNFVASSPGGWIVQGGAVFRGEFLLLTQAEAQFNATVLPDPILTPAACIRAREAFTLREHIRPNGEPFITALQEVGVTVGSFSEIIAWSPSLSYAVPAWRMSILHNIVLQRESLRYGFCDEGGVQVVIVQYP